MTFARLAFLAASILFALALTFSACKQGEGETCQINDDCKSGLICNAATGKCQTPGVAQRDAGVDAGAVDAPAADAAIDAAPDAAIDAAL